MRTRTATQLLSYFGYIAAIFASIFLLQSNIHFAYALTSTGSTTSGSTLSGSTLTSSGSEILLVPRTVTPSSGGGYSSGSGGGAGAGTVKTLADLIAEGKLDSVSDDVVKDVSSATTGYTDNEAPTFRNIVLPTDISGHWAENYISILYSKGIVSGDTTANNNYLPNESINRAEFAKMLVKAFPSSQVQGPVTASFSDIPNGRWFTPYIENLRLRGVTQGYADGTFRAGDSINRIEALKMILVASGQYDSVKNMNGGDTTCVFSDVKTNDWSVPYVNYAKSMGVIEGKSPTSYDPGGSITRAEAAKIIALLIIANNG